MSYSVRILSLAKKDRRSLFQYLDKLSPQGAEAWETSYESGLLRLEDNPYQFGLAPEDSAFDFPLRQMLFQTKSGKPYRAIFRIDNQVVTILRIRGHGQSEVRKNDLR